jgi:NAD+ synthase
MTAAHFSPSVLDIDCAEAVEHISRSIRRALVRCRRRGVVVGLSGGVDSSVTAAVCVRAIGRERVFGLHMPERDSARESLELSQSLSNHLRMASAIEDITPALTAVGCYARQEEAIREVVPQYGGCWKSKLVVEQGQANGSITTFSIVAQAPDGTLIRKPLKLSAYLALVAATNFKQRVRKMMEYYHADRRNYAVAGTPNRLEYDQGFFVKLGDGAADLKPIAHLYKSQVYQLAEYLELPEAIRLRPPTTDTYSLPQGQDEFYFALPYDKLDLCLCGKNNGVAPEVVAPAVGLSASQVRRVYQDIDRKRSTTHYLHMKPELVVPVEVDTRLH